MGSVPRFEVSAIWSDEGQRVNAPETAPVPTRVKDYMYVTARAYLPVILSSGYHVRWLTPSIQYVYRNSLNWSDLEQRYLKDESYMVASLQYGNNVRRSQLDLIPRWGYALKASAAGNPFDSRYNTTWSGFARVYIPGLARHHGLSISAAGMKQDGKGTFNLTLMDILPRGYDPFYPKRYVGGSANYYFPVAYPDAGISGVVFLKRIWMTAGVDYARYSYQTGGAISNNNAWSTIWSWGGTLNLDIVPFRLPSQATCTLSVSCFVPQNTKKPFLSFNFSVPL